MFLDIWKIGALVSAAVLLPEIAYYSIRWLRDLLTKRGDVSSTDEISEVIWTNELTQKCCDGHINNSSDGDAEFVSSIKEISKSTTTNKPCPNRYCAANNLARLVALIDKTRYCLDLAMYTFSSNELSDAIERAVQRGVEVRIISDNQMVYSSGSAVTKLTKADIPVRCPASRRLMHHKFCILDGPLRVYSLLEVTGKKCDERVLAVLMSGSLNWTLQGLGGNWENIIITSNKSIVEQFELEYQRMWEAFQVKELKSK